MDNLTKKNTLSLFIIAKNEAHNIANCLESVQGLVDEIVVVDGNSTDNTKQIAEGYGAKVYIKKFNGFQEQKQFALDKCTSKWVLNLDADESLTPELKTEIANLIKEEHKETLFFIRERVVFLGRLMKHSGLTGKKHERLALREKAKYIGGLVHEKLITDGKTATLKYSFIHTPYTSIEQYFDKHNKYTTLGAEKVFNENKKFKFFNLLRQPIDFIKIYIFRLGFLDGVQGFLWAWFSSTYPTTKYAKLWFLEYNKKCKK